MHPHLMHRARLVAVALIALVLAGIALIATAPAAESKRAAKPLIIGHRGAAGYRPEHTLASYELAARMGADYIEPDLVITKDGALVVRHEPEIGGTTNVADHPEFASRKTTKNLDGTPTTGWFVEDFTLRELRTLRAKERLPLVRQRNTLYDNRYKIPTFGEVIRLRARLSKALHRTIGIYPETKHPTYFRDQGLPLEGHLVRALNRAGLNKRGAPVFVQSFETANLKALRSQLKVRLVQLFDAKNLQPFDIKKAGGKTTYGDLATPAGLRSVAQYANGVGPSKDYVFDVNSPTLAATSFVKDAHAAKLLVHPYTFRNENQFLPAAARRGTDPNAYGDAFKEYNAAFAAGVDGLFSDNSDTAVAARAER